MSELLFLAAQVPGQQRTQVRGLAQNQRKKWNFNNKWMLNFLVISTKILAMKRLKRIKIKLLILLIFFFVSDE
jgi:hypothetical protein